MRYLSAAFLVPTTVPRVDNFVAKIFAVPVAPREDDRLFRTPAFFVLGLPRRTALSVDALGNARADNERAL